MVFRILFRSIVSVWSDEWWCQKHVENHSAILKTCKAIHAEAERVLYGERSFEITVRGLVAPMEHPEIPDKVIMTVEGNEMADLYVFEKAEGFTLPGCTMDFGRHLHSVRHFKLSVHLGRTFLKHFSGESEGECLIRMSRLLYRIAGELVECPLLRTLVVEVDIDGNRWLMEGAERALRASMYPLAILISLRQRGVRVQSKGLPDVVVSHLSRYQMLVVRGNTYERVFGGLHEAAYILEHAQKGRSPTGLFEKLKQVVDRAHCILSDTGVVNSVLDRKMALCAYHLSKLLRSEVVQASKQDFPPEDDDS